MSDANFSFLRVELPTQDGDGMITSKRGETFITAALTQDTQLRQMLTFAHTLATALDVLAADIAMVAGVEADSDQITDAVFNCNRR